jgi:hypothetical protein
MLPLSPAHGLVVFQCLIAASAALAQAMPGTSMPAGSTHAPAGTPTPDGLGYRSVFEGYRAFADDPPSSWQDANRTVGHRGGWKAYATESGAARADSTMPSEPNHQHHHAPPPAASEAPPPKDRP